MKNFSYPSHTFIIAEISANHGQSLERALKLIRQAAQTGVDAIKFQVYTPDTLTLNCHNKYFMIDHPEWGGQTLHELYKRAYTPWDWFPKLIKAAKDEGVTFFASVFDRTSVDYMESLDAELYKIASFELVDTPLIEYTAQTQKPLIMSTGMATLDEIKKALKAARKGGAKDVRILKCVSAYPAAAENMNLFTIPDMKKMFGIPVGLSDHTLGIGVSVAAVTLGAQIIEKHIITSRKVKTPDSFFSLEPDEFRELVSNIRTVEAALGKVHYGLTVAEKKSRAFRRSLFVAEDIKKGQVLNHENIRSVRPSHGLPPDEMNKIAGRKAQRNLKKGMPLKTTDFL